MPKCTREERFQIGRGHPLPFDDRGGKVYYYLNNVGSIYDRTETEYIINAAFAEWNKHLYPLQILPTGNPDKAYIQIYFSGIKKEWRWMVDLLPFTRKLFVIEPIPLDDMTYAYGFEAGHTKWAGHIYINDAVLWDDSGIDLCKVLVHEIGHVCNLGHTQNWQAHEIMLPEYEITNVITEDTIQGIHEVYAEIKAKYLNTT